MYISGEMYITMYIVWSEVSVRVCHFKKAQFQEWASCLVDWEGLILLAHISRKRITVENSIAVLIIYYWL